MRDCRILDIVMLLTISAVLASCTKSVFIHVDEDGMSKFKMYKKNYWYEEDSKFGKFSESGTYTLNDSVVSFIYKNRERLPYTYLDSNVELKGNRQSKAQQFFFLTELKNGNPVPFASIIVKDRSGKIITGSDTDINGKGKIDTNIDVHKITISSIGYYSLDILYDEYSTYDLNVSLEEIKPGGRMSSGCLTHYLDILLEYKVDDPSNINKLERNGMVYQKQLEER